MHDGSMAAVVLHRKPTNADVMAAARRLRLANEEMRALVGEAEGPVLGEALIQVREAGIDIARRTVAKYREAMRIPSSVQRRRDEQAALGATG